MTALERLTAWQEWVAEQKQRRCEDEQEVAR